MTDPWEDFEEVMEVKILTGLCRICHQKIHGVPGLRAYGVTDGALWTTDTWGVVCHVEGGNEWFYHMPCTVEDYYSPLIGLLADLST